MRAIVVVAVVAFAPPARADFVELGAGGGWSSHTSGVASGQSDVLEATVGHPTSAASDVLVHLVSTYTNVYTAMPTSAFAALTAAFRYHVAGEIYVQPEAGVGALYVGGDDTLGVAVGAAAGWDTLRVASGVLGFEADYDYARLDGHDRHTLGLALRLRLDL